MATKNTSALKTKLDELDKTVKYFDDSNKDFSLEEGIQRYEEAMKLVTELKKELTQFELKIQEIQSKYTGEEE